MASRFLIIAILAVGAASVSLTVAPPQRHGLPPEAAVIRPDVAKLLFRSALPLLIDFYWLQAIHTIGAARREDDSRRLHQYGRFLAEMDPKFYEPYWVIGLNVPWSLGREEWKLCDEGLDLFHRGLEQFPDDLKLLSYMSWNYLECKRDYRRAAETLQALSSNPAAPSWTWSLATRLYSMSGGVSEALSLTRDLLASATTDEERALFSRRVEELEVEELLQAIDAQVAAFTNDHGRPPGSLNELVYTGYLSSPPVDPHGGELSLGDDHRARSTSQGRRLEIFVDERARRN